MSEKSVGRPLKFSSVKELDNKIDAYFAECEEKGRPKTITGLALALDTTRETLLDYQSKEDFSDTIKRAKLKCENFAEEHLFSGRNVAGAIFNLKNNYSRWVDQQVIKNESSNDAPTNEEVDKRIEELMSKVKEN